jgi:hypothetical protein
MSDAPGWVSPAVIGTGIVGSALVYVVSRWFGFVRREELTPMIHELKAAVEASRAEAATRGESMSERLRTIEVNVARLEGFVKKNGIYS